jgi:methionyl aminopeptidase
MDEVQVLEDSWTVITKDGKFSAHFEDTIAVLAEGPQNLTRVG